MALVDIVSRTRTLLYGVGLGEKPPIREVASDASETITGQKIVFTMDTDEGAKIKPGDVLSVYGAATAALSHVVYVLSMSSEVVTAVNGYMGSPVIPADGVDGALVEQNPPWSAYEIFEAIDTVFANLLWPYVYDIVSATIASPDLVDSQEAVASETEEILHAWQVIGPTVYNVAVSPRFPLEVSTDLKSTGKMVTFDWVNSSTGYYEYRAKYLLADEVDTELTHLVALGATALLLGGSMVEATLERTKKDNADAVMSRAEAGSIVWRDFLTLRQTMSEELSKRLPQQIYINRG